VIWFVRLSECERRLIAAWEKRIEEKRGGEERRGREEKEEGEERRRKWEE
jgi:hypothetical protein